MKKANKGLFLAAMLVPTLAHSQTLLDLVDKQIEQKNKEIAAKSANPSVPPLVSTTSAVGPTGQTGPSVPPLASIGDRGGFRSDEIQVYAIGGVGEDLRAKAIYRDSRIDLSVGSTLQDVKVTQITPDSVTFEQSKTSKDSKGREVVKVLKRKIVYVSSAGAANSGVNNGQLGTAVPPLMGGGR